jgi:hypothetical protein
MPDPVKSGLGILACLLSLACLAFSVSRCLEDLAYVDIAALSPIAGEAGMVGADLRLYINTGSRFQATGQLYERPDREGESIADVYAPMAPVFKFPPAFQLQLLPIINSSDPEGLIRPIRMAMTAGYFLACLALVIHAGKILRRQQQPATRIVLFCTLAAIAATSSNGLQTGVLITNYEIPIFCLLTAAFFLYRKYPVLTACIIGYLASVKLYPAFMASLLLLGKNGRAIASCGLAALLVSAAGWLAFGAKENLFFYQQILPALLSEGVAPILYNASFGGAIFRFSQELGVSHAAFQGYRLAFLLLSCYVLARQFPKCQAYNIGVYALLMTLMLISLPNYWPNYLIMLFPAFCVASCRVAVRPGIVSTVLLLLCMASMAIDAHAWLHTGSPAWLGSNTPPDAIGNSIIAAANQGDTNKALFLFALHYPWTALLYCLEQAKFIVPAILWFFTAREILSPVLWTEATPLRSADLIKP